jgi:hypothetical protein
LTTGSATTATCVGLVNVPDVLTETVVGGAVVDNVVVVAVGVCVVVVVVVVVADIAVCVAVGVLVFVVVVGVDTTGVT